MARPATQRIELVPELAVAPSPAFDRRCAARGKFVFVGERKFWVKGVTYGTFAPRQDGCQFPDEPAVEHDFALMASNGINTVRTYTLPPRWLLDVAQRNGLRVMIGISWEQDIAFLDDASRHRSIEDKVRASVRACAGHPAVLCFAIANEIPPQVVRWYGRRRIERFLRRLYQAAKEEDPAALVTYVNFPTTEYLQLPFLDLVCFNVYLESRECLEAYLARLQNLAGERPLLLAEIGLDSRRNGEHAQAQSLAWQVRSAFAAGCAGSFVFAWTDSWHRGGEDIKDWDFGITTRARHPKAALAAVRKAYAEVPFPRDLEWPRISVVVCSCNGARTIRDTFEGLKRLEYPDFEVIVIDDGSSDATAEIAAEYAVQVISTENRGLSSARNTGWQRATGEIVAYIDDDAYPDAHWLHYLAYTFMSTDCVGVGGPNIAPAGDGPIAECVANAPGGPVHVLVSDREAEHIPGCNMAFRRDALAAVGGFDPRYRAAGDDVDLCWRLQERGGRICFHAGAMDWHHRRNSLAAYWRQQMGYGKAEALLEEKWPERYDPAGHLAWAGRLYGRGITRAIPVARSRIYGGVWGSAAYQSLYEPAPLTLLCLPLMPEWYLVIAALAGISALGLSWAPLALAVPLLVLATGAPLAQAALSASRAEFPRTPVTLARRVERRLLTAMLHLMQPLARLLGRLQHGLTPWRRRAGGALRFRTVQRDWWREIWRAREQSIEDLESALRADGVPTLRGLNFDAWDLAARCGTLGGARALLAIEEHGAGKQRVRWRLWAHASTTGVAAAAIFSALALGAALDQAWVAATALAAISAALAWRTAIDCGAALGALDRAVRRIEP